MNAATGLKASMTHELVARAAATCECPPDPNERNPAYRAVGIALAIGSGLFIGVSFVLKKVGLLKANVKYNEEAGEGYGYLKNAYWWSGMTLMIIGEICNFVAYAFVDAILVTPLGALSVVVTTILSATFLKERLSFVGKVGCFMCIIGSIVIVMNAPAHSSVASIEDMQHYIISPGFLTYAGVIIVGCTVVAFWVGPRYGKKSMLVYLTVCSLIGGLSVVATQGLGAAVVKQAEGVPQFNQWFLYVLLVFVVATLLTEIIYLNKALNLFNAALVTPTYYVYFTSSTIVASAILFRGFAGSPIQIATMAMGFLQICAGVVLLQLSKSAKDIPDAAVFTGDLDQIRTVGEQEQPESEPKADAIRGTAALIRRISQSRQKMEADEARKVYEEKLKDQMEPIKENEQVEWDGLRRRKTILEPGSGSMQRRRTLHPPLGLTRFPSYDEDQAVPDRPDTSQSRNTSGGFLGSFRRRTSSSRISVSPAIFSPLPAGHEPIPEGRESIAVTRDKELDPSYSPDGLELKHVYGLPEGLRPLGASQNSSYISSGDHTGKPVAWALDTEDHRDRKRSRLLSPTSAASSTKRQFSFQNVFHRHRDELSNEDFIRKGQNLRLDEQGRQHSATEEEQLGLVKGDSGLASELSSGDDESRVLGKVRSSSEVALPQASREHEMRQYEANRQRWSGSSPELSTPGNGKALPQPPTDDHIGDDDPDDARQAHGGKRDARSGGSAGAFI